MSNGVGRFNLLDAIARRGFAREKSFQDFLKGQAERVTETVGKEADRLQAEATKQQKGIGGKDLPWLKTALSFLGPWGKLANVGISVADTIKKNKDYDKAIKSLGKDIKVPDWAKGTFMEDYFKSNVDYLQDVAVQKLKQTRDAELAAGVAGSLLDMFSTGKGFGKGAGKGIFKGLGKGASSALLSDYGIEELADMGIQSAPLKKNLFSALGQGLKGGVLSKISPGAIKGMGAYKALDALSSPIFKGTGALTTQSTYASFLQQPLVNYLTGQQSTQEPTIQRMAAPMYRRRR